MNPEMRCRIAHASGERITRPAEWGHPPGRFSLLGGGPGDKDDMAANARYQNAARRLGATLLGALLACSDGGGPVVTGNYYVATTGSNLNPGTATAPFRTIQHAADVVNPGDTVIVRDGIYSSPITLERGGTSAAWVTFQAEHKWGAKLSGGDNTIREGWLFASGASYVRVEGFELYGFLEQGFSNFLGGQNLAIVGNNIHDIGRYCNESSLGSEGVSSFHPHVTIEGNVIHDIGRFAPGENGCVPTTTYYKDHDHPISLEDAAGDITIRNNIFYNMKRGYAIQLYGGTFENVNIENNTFAFANPYTDGHIVVNASLVNSRIDNNIFYDPTNVAIVFAVSSHSNTTVRNNVAYPDTVSSGSTSGVTFSGNLPSTDPKLVNASTFDFHLQSGSPAIDTGLTLSDVTVDYDGHVRPQGAAYDIGAYEYVGSLRNSRQR